VVVVVVSVVVVVVSRVVVVVVVSVVVVVVGGWSCMISMGWPRGGLLFWVHMQPLSSSIMRIIFRLCIVSTCLGRWFVWL
jgi:hypothetical protein